MLTGLVAGLIVLGLFLVGLGRNGAETAKDTEDATADAIVMFCGFCLIGAGLALLVLAFLSRAALAALGL